MFDGHFFLSSQSFNRSLIKVQHYWYSLLKIWIACCSVKAINALCELIKCFQSMTLGNIGNNSCVFCNLVLSYWKYRCLIVFIFYILTSLNKEKMFSPQAESNPPASCCLSYRELPGQVSRREPLECQALVLATRIHSIGCIQTSTLQRKALHNFCLSFQKWTTFEEKKQSKTAWRKKAQKCFQTSASFSPLSSSPASSSSASTRRWQLTNQVTFTLYLQIYCISLTN